MIYSSDALQIPLINTRVYRAQSHERLLGILVSVQKAGDLSSESAGLEQLTHAAGVVEELPSELSWRRGPLHEQGGPEASQDMLLLVCEGDAARSALIRAGNRILIIIREPLLIICKPRESPLKLL